MSLQRGVAAKAVCPDDVDFCRLAIAPALAFGFMALVHSGVYLGGPVGLLFSASVQLYFSSQNCPRLMCSLFKRSGHPIKKAEIVRS